MALHPYSPACAHLYLHLEHHFTLAIRRVTVLLTSWQGSPFSAHAARSGIKQILSNEILSGSSAGRTNFILRGWFSFFFWSVLRYWLLNFGKKNLFKKMDYVIIGFTVSFLFGSVIVFSNQWQTVSSGNVAYTLWSLQRDETCAPSCYILLIYCICSTLPAK